MASTNLGSQYVSHYSKYFVTFFFLFKRWWNWREGSAVRSEHCSCRGPESSSQHTHPSGTPVHTCTGMYIRIIKIKFY